MGTVSFSELVWAGFLSLVTKGLLITYLLILYTLYNQHFKTVF